MKRSVASGVSAVAGFAVFAAAGGCALVAGLADDRSGYPADGSTVAVADAGSDAPSTGDTGAASCDGGPSCSDVCEPGVIYVSTTTGNDANSGCNRFHPKQRLMSTHGAVETASSAASTTGMPQEVRVCKGTYAEENISTAPHSNFAMGANVSLHGGYDCATWSRTAHYGYPSFDGVNLTELQAAPIAGPAFYSGVQGLEINGGVTVEGFLITAKPVPGSVNSTAGVDVKGQGTQLNNCVIVGATGTEGNSYGVYVEPSSSPEIANNRISGGSGGASSDGTLTTAGIRLSESCTANIHDNLITTDKSADTAMYGIFAVPTDGGHGTSDVTTIRGNEITAGDSTAQRMSEGQTSVGVAALGIGVRILGNRVQSGSAMCEMCRTAGVSLSDLGAGVLRQAQLVAGNRIVQTGSLGDGIVVNSNASVTIVNNAVAAAGSVGSTAIALLSIPSATIEHNTIFGTGDGIYLDPASTAVVRNNLLIGDATASGSMGFQNDSCSGTSTFETNAFLALATLTDTAQMQSGSCAKQVLTTTTIAAVNTSEGPLTSGNILVASECVPSEASAGCVSVPSCPNGGTSCIHPIISTWPMSDDDDVGSGGDGGAGSGAARSAAASVMTSSGWALADMQTPCKVARGGQALVDGTDTGVAGDAGASSLSVDINNVMRDPTHPTVGAYELTGTCAP